MQAANDNRKNVARPSTRDTSPLLNEDRTIKVTVRYDEVGGGSFKRSIRPVD